MGPDLAQDGDEEQFLSLELEGFEGPLHVLLALAQDQKVDLAHISILALVEQYLAFISGAGGRRLELAADYLVMAAWLAYLKSRLLLPKPDALDETPPEEMAAALTLQLRKLAAMRRAGEALMARPLLYREVWPRGATGEPEIRERSSWRGDLFALLSGYGAVHRRRSAVSLDIEPADLYSMDDALSRLKRLLGETPDWRAMSACLPSRIGGLLRRSAAAAHFAAILELCREGRAEIRQEAAFAEIYVRLGKEGAHGVP